MNKLQFKLIPFLISLLIVVGVVGGICSYSYYKYDNNKLRFVADYFHYEDHSKVSSEEQIENFVKMESSYYQVVEDGLKFYDVKSANQYTERESSSSKNFIQGATWKDGVLHLPGFFDIKFYAETTWNSTEEDWVFSYYAFIYNVNYYTPDLVSHLYFAFVDGVGESDGVTELYGTTKLDLVIDEVKDGVNGGPNTINTPSYKYTGKTASSYSMYLYDNGATLKNESDETPYIYRLTSLNESFSETSDLDDGQGSARWFSELESATFSIFYSGKNDLVSSLENESGAADLQEIVRGTFNRQFKDAEEFNASCGKNGVNQGYSQNVYEAGYGKFIAGRIAIQGVVAFVISGILAFLFYLIWQDDEETMKQVKYRAPKPKKNK